MAGAIFPKLTTRDNAATQEEGRSSAAGSSSSSSSSPPQVPAQWILGYGRLGTFQRVDSQEPCMHFHRTSTTGPRNAMEDDQACLKDTPRHRMRSSGESIDAFSVAKRAGLNSSLDRNSSLPLRPREQVQPAQAERQQQQQQQARRLKLAAHKAPRPPKQRPTRGGGGEPLAAASNAPDADALLGATSAAGGSSGAGILSSSAMAPSTLAAKVDRLKC